MSTMSGLYCVKQVRFGLEYFAVFHGRTPIHFCMSEASAQYFIRRFMQKYGRKAA